MTVPLPSGSADKLIQHINNCPTCKAAKTMANSRKCPKGRDLLRLTLLERHGWATQ